MKTRMHMTAVSMMVGASLALVLWPCLSAFASVNREDAGAGPPNGWDHLCTPQSISVSPRTTSREYSASATCWVNMASDKASLDNQDWVQAQATMTGRYFMSSNRFSEAVTLNLQSGPVKISEIGTVCGDDPWATQATCSVDTTRAFESMYNHFGWRYGSTYSDVMKSNAPLSRSLFDAALVQAQLHKQASSPPSAPGGVQAVIWPAQDGKSAIGNISWHAGDMSGNKWVLMFDIESSQFSDGTFINSGHRSGLGPKQNMSAADANRLYIFTPTASLQIGGTYFFRVCAVNDAGRQCSAPVQARAPTQQERMTSGGMHVVAGGILTPIGTNPPGGGNPGGPVALGTARPRIGGFAGSAPAGGGTPAGGNHTTPLGGARPIGPVALGGLRPAGGGTPAGGSNPTGGSGGSGGSGGLTPAGAPPTSIGGNRPGEPAGGGAPGIALRRPLGPVARMEPRGGTQPGAVGIPDLTVDRAMLVRGRPIAWGSTVALTLRADATHTCPVPMSFHFRNAGSGPAQNVTAALRDSQNPMQPIAAETLASMTVGQAATVGGVLKVEAAPAARTLVVVAGVHEAGKIHEKDVANNHGSISLNVTCN
jgi:hypothetical protein